MKNRGSIEERKIYSGILDEEITLMIYYPYNYSTLYKYSLLIAHDGSDYFKFGRMARTMDELLEGEEIEDLIVVGIPYNSVEERKEKYHPDGKKQGDFMRFLANELSPYLDEQFPTYHLGSSRAMIGDSLAATISLTTALQYPRTFGKVLLQSPFVNEEIIQMVEDFNSPELLSIYHVAGTEETDVKTTDGTTKDFITPNRELNKVLGERGFDYFYEEFEGDHTWKYWQKDLKRALKMMFKK
ncbi:alpha/beta hydrolase [Pseudalkalibacillus caeni]|uniref:Esterase family protein n=1 Tax=Exobacillus caeni TaxID=2574798 RepID=A0A5R9F5X0_9BACL|nr:alpha/beta hydrolase-fold protein [Pseudalkalibacillus caeni]TLS37780.1 esterase family protein [Pseudalkalibacillus caeni]